MRALALGVFLLWAQLSTAAPVTWGFLPGSQWSDGSPITGSFTWDPDTLTISNIDIWTGVSLENPDLAFSQYGGFHYTEMLSPDAMTLGNPYVGQLEGFDVVGQSVNDPSIKSVFWLFFTYRVPGPDGAVGVCPESGDYCVFPEAHMSDYAAEWVCGSDFYIDPTFGLHCEPQEPLHLNMRGNGPGLNLGTAAGARLAIVPVPAAAWLFVGALAGLGACRRLTEVQSRT